jgi:uncharacterized protein (DUF362 family)
MEVLMPIATVDGSAGFDRRTFLRTGAAAAAGSGLLGAACGDDEQKPLRVAIVRQSGYDVSAIRASLERAVDLLGGIENLVKDKTVTVKVNLTGYAEGLFGRPPGETYSTHPATAVALASLLTDLGATSVCFAESCSAAAPFEAWAEYFGWTIADLAALGTVTFENTRNLGSGAAYGQLAVPGTPRMFSYFRLNHRYTDTEVMVSLAKMKNHVTAGVTLSMKNMFGSTPNALYGTEAGTRGEGATAYRGCLHTRAEGNVPVLPGELSGFEEQDAYFRVPRIITDIVAARPIDLAIIDGITTMSGGEGPWNASAYPLRALAPGVLVAGLNPVATDAVAVRIMGYGDPLAQRGAAPFAFCDNHIQMAHDAGLGMGDVAQLEVLGESIDAVATPFAWI